MAWAAHGPIDHDVPALVLLDRQAGHHRVGNNPRRQDDGIRFNRFFRQVDLARLDGPHNGVGPEYRATPLAEHPGPVIGECRVDFRHDVIGALEQKKLDIVAVDVFVKWRDPVHECRQFAEQLDADQSPADDCESEQAAFALRVGLHIGALETLDHVVAEHQGVGERLEREGVLRTWDHHAVGHRPEGQDQLVVRQFTSMSLVATPLPGGENGRGEGTPR